MANYNHAGSGEVHGQIWSDWLEQQKEIADQLALQYDNIDTDDQFNDWQHATDCQVDKLLKVIAQGNLSGAKCGIIAEIILDIL